MTELLDTLQRWFVSLPHCATLGFEFIGVEDGKPTLKVNYRDDLVGNGSNGVIHGGVITSLVDTTSALSVFSHLDSAEAMATLDLRIDYLKAATPGLAIYCTAECYKLTRQIGFTRAVCHHGDPSDPIAHGVATFMRGSSNAILGGDATGAPL